MPCSIRVAVSDSVANSRCGFGKDSDAMALRAIITSILHPMILLSWEDKLENPYLGARPHKRRCAIRHSAELASSLSLSRPNVGLDPVGLNKLVCFRT